MIHPTQPNLRLCTPTADSVRPRHASALQAAPSSPTADCPLPTAFPPARIFFDVDDTILTWRHRLRPLTREVMAELTDAGFAVYLWSGVGRRWEVVERFGLGSY